MTKLFGNQRMAFPALAFTVCILMHHQAHADDLRTWTSSSGKQVVAEMLSATDDQVELLLRGGSKSSWVPIKQLSSADQDYVHQVREQKKAIPSSSLSPSARKGDSRELNQRMTRLAAEFELPVADGLPLCWLGNSSRNGDGLSSNAWKN